MIFYATALSSYSAKVRIALCAKGVVFEERLPPEGYRSAQYQAIVPMGKLPAIQEGDWVLSESEAINEYLEERYPEPPLLPQGAQERAQVRFLASLAYEGSAILLCGLLVGGFIALKPGPRRGRDDPRG